MDHPAGPVRTRVAVLFGLALATLSAAWAVASPVGSVPDEYMHYKYAYALWSGQVSTTSGPYELPETLVVPRQVCYSMKPTQTPACEVAEMAGADEDEFTEVRTTANHYPPLFYSAAGWPIRISPDDAGIIGARLVSAVLCSALVALGVQRLSTVWSRRTLLGILLCLMPTVVYFFGGFNPQGLELALVITMLGSAMAVLRSPRRIDVLILLSSSVGLALARPLGFTWPVMILGLLLVAFWHRNLGRRAVVVFAASGLASFLAGAALAVLLPVDNDGKTDPGTTLGSVVGNSLQRFLAFPQEWVGTFGHLDTPLSGPFLAMWWIAAASVVLIGLGSGRHRLIATTGLAVVSGAAFALALEYRTEAGWGYVMLQGRYVLPLVFLALLLLAVAAAQVRLIPVSGMVTVVIVLWALVQSGAFVQALHRFMFGTGVNPLAADASWHPPVSAALLVALAVAGSAAVGVMVRLMIVPTSPPGDGADGPVALAESGT